MSRVIPSFSVSRTHVLNKKAWKKSLSSFFGVSQKKSGRGFKELHCFAYPIPPNHFYGVIYGYRSRNRGVFASSCVFLRFYSCESRFCQSLNVPVAQNPSQHLNFKAGMQLFKTLEKGCDVKMSHFNRYQQHFYMLD